MYDTTFSSDAMNRASCRMDRVGSLDNPDDSELKKTFRGSRVNSDGKNVNQNIALSFDPATLVCISCAKPHSIIPTDGSGLAFMVGDQNFTSTLCGGNSCLPVIRIEDSTLEELVSICMEILDRHQIPAGTLFLISSVSHLSKVGTTRYCMDWITCRDRILARWRQAKLGPLPPIIRCDTTSTVGKQLIELVIWFDIVYNHLTEYPRDAWHTIVRHIGSTDENGLDLMHREKYTVAVPHSLTDKTLTNIWFTHSSSHTVTPGMDGGATDELLRALIGVLDTDFACNANPEDIVFTEPAIRHGTMENSNKHAVVIIGGSNMSRIAHTLKQQGWEVTDLTVPGWSPSPANIEKTASDISTLTVTDSTVVIMDIMANHAFRFEQEDGSLALPVKMGGRFHMLGTVRVCNKDTVYSTVARCKGILDKFGCTKVVLPPFPRYIHAACCTEQGHCTDTGIQKHTNTLLESTLGMRKHVKDSLVKISTKNFVVPDVIQQILGEKSDIVKMAAELQHISADDGVHFTSIGYRKVADMLAKTIIENARPASVIVSGGSAAAGSGFYWRGFLSPVGSVREPENYKLIRNGGGKWRHVNKPHQLSNRGGPFRASRGRGFPPGGRFHN